MSDVLEIVASIFGLIGIGYALARSRLLAEGTGDALADFAFALPIPALLFRTLATADFAGLSPWRLWAAYFGAAAVVWALGHLLIRRAFGRDARAGVVAGVSAAFSNIVLIGVPLAQTAFGEEGLVVVLVVISIHLPVMMTASIVLNEWAVRADGVAEGPVDALAAARRLAGNLLRHPIILGIAAGALWRTLGLPLEGLPGRLVGSLAAIAGPVALLATGMGLARYGVSGHLPPAVTIAALKVMVLPALVFAAGSALGLTRLEVTVVTMVAACPTGVNAYLIASRFGTGQALAGNTILLSTAVAVVTMSLWLAVTGRGV